MSAWGGSRPTSLNWRQFIHDISKVGATDVCSDLDKADEFVTVLTKCAKTGLALIDLKA